MEPTNLFGWQVSLPILTLFGVLILLAHYSGKAMRWVKMPSLLGFMVIGVILGPSAVNLFTDALQEKLGFITDIALGFVAVSIGLELNFNALKKLGSSIIWIIFAESFGAFILVTAAVFALTRDWPISLLFGSIAPASAPAGTVAVIQEYRARGTMTKALYAILGFDDGLGIIIFGFCAAIARLMLEQQAGAEVQSVWMSMLEPLFEIGLSIGIGIATGYLFSLVVRRASQGSDMLVLMFGFVFLNIGLCNSFNLSLILTNMAMGMVVVNTQPSSLIHKLGDRLTLLMPLLFVMFFSLAGASLHMSELPSLGLLGAIYILSRSAGLIFGSQIGAVIGKAEDKIRKWVGLGILNQAGVAIGLSLIVKHTFRGLGAVVDVVDGVPVHTGDIIGVQVITTVTASSIVFGVIGPILAKVALTKAGEINQAGGQS